VSSYHQILGVSENASLAEVKKAYRTLARKFHPDMNAAEDAAEQFIRITEAYEILTGERMQKQSSYARPFSYEDLARERAKAYARMRYEEFKKKCDAFESTPMHKLLWPAWVNFVFIAIALFFITDSLLPKKIKVCSFELSKKNFFMACGKKLTLSEHHLLYGLPVGDTVLLRVTPIVGYISSYDVPGDDTDRFLHVPNSETEYIVAMYLLLILAVLTLMNKTKKIENKLLIKIGMCISTVAYGVVFLMWLNNKAF